ncbi:phage major capsid protein [Streptomyces sp. MUM 178J]|uniref:phage major capsid protein n=1 Tax=Streptomyces sp. MUM 178J TaxID=2791991 RepID=UPI001F03EB2F|nr:phage major capsid protein [Streptomyces sp. MUM 178J]WRQ80292.1 phage major capsid protein [Streptomyces sp. MUM 178J]
MTALKIRELKAERTKLATQAQGIYDKAERAGRELSGEEAREFDRLMNQADKADAEIQRAERALEADRHGLDDIPDDDRFTGRDRRAGGRGSVRLETADGKELRGFLPTERMSGPDTGEHPVGRAILGAVTGHTYERDMGVAVAPSGGFFVDDKLSAMLIDQARAQSIMTMAGALTVPIEGSTEIVRVTGDPAAAWRSEHATIAETDLTLGRISLRPKTLAAMVTLSEELAMDAPNAPAVVESVLSAAVASQLDRAFVRGESGGLPSPIGTGLLDDADVHTVALNAAPTDYSPWLDAIGEIWGSNIEPAVRVDSPRTARDLAKLQRGTGDAMQLSQPAEVAALRHIRSSQIPTDLGAGTDESISVVGNLTLGGAGVMLGVRSGLRLEATRTASDAFDRLQVKIRIWGRFAFAIARPSGIALITGIQETP